MKKIILSLVAAAILVSCNSSKEVKNTLDESKDVVKETENVTVYDSIDFSKYELIANETEVAPIIDGDSSDTCWGNQTWYPIQYVWMGKPVTKDDFEGRFKLSWDANKLYLLVEITDDSLVDTHEAWDDNWWNDDCVEIFIDENNGDEEHQFNYNAFAYHVALNTQDVVDLGTDSLPHLYNNHIQTSKITNGKTTVWEFAIDIYDDSFVYEKKENTIVTLTKGKQMGFCLNYCDNDTSETRENFISSIPVTGETDEERDQGWKQAGVFNDLILK